MTYEASSTGWSRWVASSLFLVVAAVLLAPVGLIIGGVLAEELGIQATSVTADTASDTVGATAAEFRVDESGAATYSIPIYGVPGTAGVAPKLALSYSSQSGYGPLGKGWAISGLSAISRCRATREAGDFIVGGVPTDGNPAPVNFTSTDRYCLDGQRLIPAPAGSAACPAVSSMSVQNQRAEIESFQRICEYTPTATPANGPAFFTVERKDGSISWYGDRDSSATSNRADGYFNSTALGKEAVALSWAQTRFQDSSGNYIDYVYLENPAGAGTGEHLISKVRYTGKTVLPGQSGTAKSPYAEIIFNYSARAAAQWSRGYQSGGALTQTRRLDSITSTIDGAQARHYPLVYATTVSGSGADILSSVQECRDSTKTVCFPATTFTWSGARNELATAEHPDDTPFGGPAGFEGFKLGDVDGDGRRDMVWLGDGASGYACANEQVHVAFSGLDASGNQIFSTGGTTAVCSPTELITPPANSTDTRNLGDASWQVFDYDGDGRDDLFVAGGPGDAWVIHPSRGRPASGQVFDTSINLLAGIPAPAIPVDRSSTQRKSHPQLADLNGDGLLDVVYKRAGVYYARLMSPITGGYGWGAERSVVMPAYPAGNPCTYAGELQLRLLHRSEPEHRCLPVA